MTTHSASIFSAGFLRPLYYLWRLPLLLLHVLFGILVACFVAGCGHPRRMLRGREPLAHRLIRWWSGRLARIFGLRLVRVGQPRTDPVMFVANHTSWIDIGLLHSQRAACFVAKAEIARWPLLGWMAATGGTIFHRRGSNSSLSSVMRTMVERMEEGSSVAVFPEGGTSYNGVLKVFHARIFQAAIDAGVMVQPVALRFTRNRRRVIDAGFRRNENFMQNLLRLLGSAPMDAEIHFLEPVPTNIAGRRNVAELARERISRALEASNP